MPENPYTVVLKDIGGKKQVELSRFDLNKNYHVLVINLICDLMDSGYDVSRTDMNKLKDWEKHSYFEISFRSKKKTGLLKKKIEYGKMHTLWIGHTDDRVTMNEVIFKLDGNNYPPNPAFKTIYRIVENKE